MSNAFDLKMIKKLVEDKHAPAVIVVDTNTVMREPNFMNWKTSLKEPVFVLADVITLELEHIKKKPDSHEHALKAIEGLNKLLDRGGISKGIQIEEVGWFIGVPTPSGDDLKLELSRKSRD